MISEADVVVVFEALHIDVLMPARATPHSVGYDVHAYIRGRTIDVVRESGPTRLQVANDHLVVNPHESVAIPLGFRARLPTDIEAQLRLRSSAAFFKGLIIPNAPATIDPDYPGEWVLLVTNVRSTPVVVEHSERIAQIVFSRFETVAWQVGKVVQTSSRSGGLGSTDR
jgi:dUTP pyrophosphatase